MYKIYVYPQNITPHSLHEIIILFFFYKEMNKVGCGCVVVQYCVVWQCVV